MSYPYRNTDDFPDISPAQELRPTDDVLTDAELRELFDTDRDEELGDEHIEVCEGEWRRDVPGKWRFWRDPSVATDA